MGPFLAIKSVFLFSASSIINQIVPTKRDDQMQPLLTQRDAAALLKISTRSLERWRVSGLGPRFCKVGNSAVRYLEADLEAWIASRVVRSTSQQLEPTNE
jgi:predicted DNA-binding transcriptional regulator AlpA